MFLKNQKYFTITIQSAIMFLVIAAIVLFKGWEIDWSEITPIYISFLSIILLGITIRHIGNKFEPVKPISFLVGNTLSYLFLFILLSATGCFLCITLGSISNIGYVDPHLDAIDKWLGFDWVTLLNFTIENPHIGKLLSYSYFSSNYQYPLIVILFACFKSENELIRLISEWLFGMMAAALLFPLFPAVAAFDFYAINPKSIPFPTVASGWDLRGVMDAIRSGENSTLDLSDLTGPVTMPSFHAAMAVMLAANFWKFRYLRWPALVLNILMFISAVPIGAHYLIDIIAGGVLGVASILFGNYFYKNNTDSTHLKSEGTS